MVHSVDHSPAKGYDGGGGGTFPKKQPAMEVETLSSEKAMLLLRIEAVSRMLDEYKATIDLAEFPGVGDL
ncbi:hypothetical protein OROGR_031147 [Orobanche gracilis]